MGRLGDIKVSFVDSKTIFFQAPPCPILLAEQDLSVPIIVTQNDLVIARINFLYLARKLLNTSLFLIIPLIVISAIKKAANLCSRCHYEIMNGNYMSNKRPHHILEQTESDGGESLAEQMGRLTTEEVN
jgi:hypothetical protein